MKELRRFFILSLFSLFIFGSVYSQDDETRQGTGLPSLIGQNAARGDRMNISGRITLETREKLARIPVIKVVAVYAGVTADQAVANDTGYFLVKNVPRDNITLIVEVDGTEVVRQPIVASAMGNPRYDYSIRWPMTSSSTKPSVVPANPLFARNEKNEDLLQKAIVAEKDKESAKAVGLFNQILTNEPKDFVVWTELGTLYFKDNSLDNAEACYFKAIELKKDYFVALLNLGKLYVTRKQFENAVMVLSNAVRSTPDSADAHHYLGESYLQTKKGSQAVIELNEAIRLAPVEKAEIHLRLATLYDAAKMKSKAAAEYKLFLGKRPDYPEKSRLEKYIAENPAN